MTDIVENSIIATRYRVVRRVGGAVYEVVDELQGGTYALRQVHEPLPGAEAATRFRDEGRTLARLSHPNIERTEARR